MRLSLHKLRAISSLCLLLSAGTPALGIEAESAPQDGSVLPEILVMSGDATVVYNNAFPRQVMRTITSTDKTALYYASLKVIDPPKTHYKLRIECVDAEGNVLIEGSADKEIFAISRRKYLKGEVGQLEITMVLNPKPGAMVPGQRTPLKHDMYYFVRLYVDGKLLGLTSFRYLTMKLPAKN